MRVFLDTNVLVAVVTRSIRLLIFGTELLDNGRTLSEDL
jgi:hypothetical protein